MPVRLYTITATSYLHEKFFSFEDSSTTLQPSSAYQSTVGAVNPRQNRHRGKRNSIPQRTSNPTKAPPSQAPTYLVEYFDTATGLPIGDHRMETSIRTCEEADEDSRFTWKSCTEGNNPLLSIYKDSVVRFCYKYSQPCPTCNCGLDELLITAPIDAFPFIQEQYMTVHGGECLRWKPRRPKVGKAGGGRKKRPKGRRRRKKRRGKNL